ncbi:MULTISPECIES: hypothetical protein [Kitasatospora]|uniref:Uncharacterized protein n=1 Tax=Kitasatospora cineracea TaxID=88074 RepID=A0A8G1UB07_9ACTN|nr:MULTISPECIES: hypothetical protein [Kitasatospora]ROR37438.1 hypothetical protein EDD39_5581 [Kitasatospora cineracea]
MPEQVKQQEEWHDVLSAAEELTKDDFEALFGHVPLVITDSEVVDC